MNIVLHQPEIPANTGNIGRTCVATGSTLHLIEPLGFRLTGKELKRAGMDYWEHLDVRRYMNFEEFLGSLKRFIINFTRLGCMLLSISSRTIVFPFSKASFNKGP